MLADSRAENNRADEGSAIIMVLMVLVLLTALGTTLGAVTLSNLQGARRSDEASRVLAAAEAGVSQALTYMRSNGVASLRCHNTGTDAAPSWSSECASTYGHDNPVGPATAAATQARYSVWVQEKTRFVANSSAEGVYLVHAVGAVDGATHPSCQGVSGACRSITAQVVVTNFGVGSGIYSKSIQGNSNGNATITDESVFTTGCFPKRGGSFSVSGFDAAHGIPAGVHTSGIITTGPESGCDKVSNSIHAGGACNTAYPYDQDSQGGPLESTSCWSKIASDTPGGLAAVNTNVFGAAHTPGPDDVWGSKIASQQGMQDTFGLTYPPLTDSQVERLKAIAEVDGTYTTSTDWPVATSTRGVFFFDLSGASKNGNAPEVDLSQLPAPFNTESAACGGPVVIIRNGNAVISPSNKDAIVGASVFLLSPGGGTGIATLNGGKLYAGLFAEAINFNGNTTLQPANCSDGVVNPALLTISMTSYSEDD